jgi:hypothetical protein
MATTKHTACAHPRAATRTFTHPLSCPRRTPPLAYQLRADRAFPALTSGHATAAPRRRSSTAAATARSLLACATA